MSTVIFMIPHSRSTNWLLHFQQRAIVAIILSQAPVKSRLKSTALIYFHIMMLIPPSEIVVIKIIQIKKPLMMAVGLKMNIRGSFKVSISDFSNHLTNIVITY